MAHRRAVAGLAIVAALVLGALAVTAGARAQQPEAGYDPMSRLRGSDAPPEDVPLSEEFEGLPATEGAELVYYQCSACHSIRTVTQQRLSRRRWDHLLDWMVAEQGMPEPEPADRQLMLDYLARHFSPTSTSAAGGS